MARWSDADLERIQRNMAVKLREQTRTPLTPVPAGRKRRGKYGNVKVVIDGHTLDSKLEAKRYQELKLLEKAGKITHLEVHWPYYLHVHGVRLGYYEADFAYVEDGKAVIEDCKGMLTSLYKWKKRHIRAEYGIEIREIKV